MRPALEMFLTPVIGFMCCTIILLSWFGGVEFRGVPAGLIAIAVGTVIAWGSDGGGARLRRLDSQGSGRCLCELWFPCSAARHRTRFIYQIEFLGILLVTAVPLRDPDLVEAIDNVESAAVAGDSLPGQPQVLTGVGVVVDCCLLGNPFINAVYIGHPGWKAMGGRIGYSAATRIFVILLCWFGTISLMLAIIPAVAILPILLYIRCIGSQAFQETPKSHAPAIILALVPHLAN